MAGITEDPQQGQVDRQTGRKIEHTPGTHSFGRFSTSPAQGVAPRPGSARARPPTKSGGGEKQGFWSDVKERLVPTKENPGGLTLLPGGVGTAAYLGTLLTRWAHKKGLPVSVEGPGGLDWKGDPLISEKKKSGSQFINRESTRINRRPPLIGDAGGNRTLGGSTRLGQ